ALADAKLLGDPEGIAGGDREAEVVLQGLARAGDGEAAADQAEPLAAEVAHECTTIARMESGVDLDQAAERSWTHVQATVEAGALAADDRVAQAERVADHEHLAPQPRSARRRPDRARDAWVDLQERQAGVGVGGDPLRRMPAPRNVARHD